MERSDAELVGGTRGGDAEAYKALVTRYQGHVYGLAYSLVNNWADAQDLAQETFIRAYTNLDQLKEPAKFAAWLRRVTFSVSMDWLRTYRPELFRQLDGKIDLDALEVPDFQPGPPEALQRRELADAVMGAVSSLPPKYRVPLTMFHLDGLSYQKVADFLDIPLGTAKTLIHRAQQKLKAALGAYMTEEVTPMVQEVFNEHKLPAEFASKVIGGVERLRFGEGRDNQFIATLSAALRAMGEKVTYDRLMGISGAAFRLHVWVQDWCPSSVDLMGGFDHSVPALAALGYSGQWHSCNRKDAEGVQQIRAAVVQSINRGCPAIAQSLEGRGRYAVIAGYREEGQKFLCRLYDQNEEELVEATHWPWRVLILGPKAAAPPWEESIWRSLQIAVQLATTATYQRDGNQASGFAAYEQWIDHLARVPSASADAERVEYLNFAMHANGAIYECLLDARRCAARYLDEAAATLPAAVATHVKAAAGLYAQMSEHLANGRTHVPLCWHQGDRPAWTEAMRQSQVQTLHTTLAIERQTIDEVAAALRLWTDKAT